MANDFDPTASNEGMLSSLLRGTTGVAGAGLTGAMGTPATLGSLALRGTGLAAQGLSSLIGAPEQPQQDEYQDYAAEPEQPEVDNRSLFSKAADFLDINGPNPVASKIFDTVSSVTGKAADFLDVNGPNPIASKIFDTVSSVTDTAAEHLDKFDSSSLKGYLDHFTGGYTKPKGQVASALQETASDLGGMFGLGGATKIAKGVPAVVKGGMDAAKSAIKLFTAGNTIKHGAMALGVPEDSANYLKMGTMLMGPMAVGATKELFGKGTITKLSEDNYKVANRVVEAHPNKLRMNGKPAAIRGLRKYAKGGFDKLSPAKRKLLEIADKFEEKTPKGYFPVEDVWGGKKDLDEAIEVLKNNDTFMSKALPVKKILTDALGKYGERYPEFGYAFKNAETLHSINKGIDFIEEVSSSISGAKNPSTSRLISSLTAFGMGGKRAVAAYKALGPLSKQADAFVSSPAYRKHALELGKSIAMGSVPMAKRAIRGIVKLDKEDDGFALGSEERVS